MSAPHKAFILAAGYGTRLRPLTYWKPKPLLPVDGVPLIVHIIRRLNSWGVQDFIVNTHWLSEAIFAEFPKYMPEGTTLTFSREDTILGTGGALIKQRACLEHEPFWVVNADIMVEDLSPDHFYQNLDLASVWLEPRKGPRTVITQHDVVKDFRSSGGATFCGWQLVSPDIFQYLPQEPTFCSIIDAYERAIREDNRQISVVEQPQASWDDLGTIDAYTRANPNAQIIDLGMRGSNRSFTRISLGNDHRAIVVSYDPIRAENCRYAPLTRKLRNYGIAVPELYTDLSDQHTLVLEDLGSDTLEKRMQTSPESAESYYLPVIHLIAQLHKLPLFQPSELEPPFDCALYQWEQELFRKQILQRDFTPEEHAELNDLTKRLLTAKPTMIHRDFQSANVHFRSDNTPCLIDFQGMRIGAASYDLASLLYDPYVPQLDQHLLQKLLSYYQELNPDDPSAISLLPYAAIERLLQAVGAFGRLSALGMHHYKELITPTLERLSHLAQLVSYPSLEELCTTTSKSFFH